MGMLDGLLGSLMGGMTSDGTGGKQHHDIVARTLALLTSKTA